MKKVIYIFIIGFGLVATSCQKQDLTPMSKGGMELPQWEENTDNARIGDSEGEDGDNGAGIDENDENSSGIEITDPNKPSEGSGGKGGKN